MTLDQQKVVEVGGLLGKRCSPESWCDETIRWTRRLLGIEAARISLWRELILVMEQNHRIGAIRPDGG